MQFSTVKRSNRSTALVLLFLLMVLYRAAVWAAGWADWPV